MTAVRGWCPSAHRHMLSGDGLIVRIRPPMARLDRMQGGTLAKLAREYGNGLIDVTSRGNLQVRGVTEGGFPALLAALIAAGLAPADPALELPLTVTPFPDEAGKTAALVDALQGKIAKLPDLPHKMGVLIDTGPERCLADVSGDFRFERGSEDIILRADGAALGRRVTVASAGAALVEMAHWFVETGGRDAGRMARHLATTPLPDAWQTHAPTSARPAPVPDVTKGCLGVAFGQMTADDLQDCFAQPEVAYVSITPWRLILLRDAANRPVNLSASVTKATSFITDADDPRQQVVACPGAPYCPQATVETRQFAGQLAPLIPRESIGAAPTLHVSGCAKGCARTSATARVLVGRDGAFDLVLHGTPKDRPMRTGLTSGEILEMSAWAGERDFAGAPVCVSPNRARRTGAPGAVGQKTTGER
ncbi:MAG: hypothetical protein AAF718_02265 [Pseudomonadota bacterium]